MSFYMIIVHLKIMLPKIMIFILFKGLVYWVNSKKLNRIIESIYKNVLNINFFLFFLHNSNKFIINFLILLSIQP